MTDDDTTPATKADMHVLKADIHVLKADIHVLKADIQQQDYATKADVRRLESTMNERFTSVNNAIDNVLAVLVNMKNQFMPELKDHKKRITRLEHKVGIAA